MRKPSLHDLVYSKTNPKPRQNDPSSFFAHVQRNLVPEVRIEVQTYYGAIDSLEAQYPGLDYAFLPHRRRMSRYPWHRRLFRVFDELSLTKDEILSLCQWEGTRAAKERYERDSNTKIVVTTLNDVVAAPEGQWPKAHFHTEDNQKPIKKENLPIPKESEHSVNASLNRSSNLHVDDDEEEIDVHVGTRLNEQLRAAADARARGEPAYFDERWEQWMKEALERNEMDLDTILETIREGRPFPGLANDSEQREPSRENESEEAVSTSEALPRDITRIHTPISTPSVAPLPQTYDELHDILDELQNNNNRLAADNAAMARFLSRSRTQAAR